MKYPLLKYLFLFILTCSLLPAVAQELNCKVDIISDKITNVDPKVFQNLKQSLTEFLNNRKWTDDNFKPNEKIECNFLLTLQGGSDDIYTAQLNIQASRPVYNSSYNTSTVNYIDREVTFKYVATQVLSFDDNRVSGTNPLESNLTAITAYYVYLILGLDYDSFSPNGGVSYLKRAQNIVNNAPESGKQIGGWKATDGTRNRYWLVDQLLNPRFSDFVQYWYTYHRMGLDLMSQKPEDARKNILGGIPTLAKINAENPTSFLLQFFFDAKTNELANILAQTPVVERKDYIDQLSKIDVPGSAKYRSIK
jgi:hypothetical protein